MAVWGYAVIPPLVVALVALVLAPVTKLFTPVDRRRLQRFALRQALRITPDNGNVVISYLATTRRWRGGLLWVTLLLSVTWYLVTRHRVDFSAVAAFGGWFAGAVIAEWRVDSLARGGRSAALLYRRRIGDYVRRPALVTAVAVWLALPVLTVVALVASVHRSTDDLAAGAALLAVVTVGSVILLVVRRILQRPQPLVAADLLEADNAIRGRSLNTLVGSALAIGGYLGAVAIGEIVANSQAAGVGVANLFGYAALPILGVIVARAPRLVPVLPAGQPLVA